VIRRQSRNFVFRYVLLPQFACLSFRRPG